MSKIILRLQGSYHVTIDMDVKMIVVIGFSLVSLRAGLHKVGVLPKVLSFQFCLEGGIRGLRVDRLFLEDGKDTHRFLEEFKASLEVHSKVTSDPDNPFPHVLLLLQHEPEGGMGEQLSI